MVNMTVGTVDDMLESLDCVTASLETCLAWFGDKMTPADKASREAHAKRARELIRQLRDCATCETCGATVSLEHDSPTCDACEQG